MRYHTKVTLAASLLATVSTAALAADLPSRRAPPVYVPPPIPVFTWTGLYVGGNAGYAFGAQNNSTSSYYLPNGSVAGSGGTNGTLTLLGNSNRRDGFTGGGQIGYNYELGSGTGLPLLGGLGAGGFAGGGLVVGVEADAQYLGIGASNYGNSYAFSGAPGLAFVPVAGAPRATLLVNGQPRRSDFFGTVRGRVGVAFDRVLVFGTGGFAYSDRATGYAYGGGVEYGITNNITIRAEYLRVNLGNGGGNNATAAFNEAANLVTLNTNVSNRETFNVVRGAINFKFNTLAPAVPVVARY